MSRRPGTIFVLGLVCALLLRPQNTQLEDIAHLAFRVRDYDESRSFYQKLGFEQAFEFADPGKPSVSFIKINNHQFIELCEGGKDTQPGLMHICFETSDIESLGRAHLNHGLQPTETLRAGNLLFVMHDTGGQVISIPVVAWLAVLAGTPGHPSWKVSLYYYAVMFCIASVSWLSVNPQRVIVYAAAQPGGKQN